MNLLTLTLIFVCIILNVGAQIALKQGAFLDIENLNLANFIKLFSSQWIIAGGIAYVVSVFVWLLVLHRTEVSKAYPLSSIGYILNAIAAYYLLGEQVTVLRILGIVVILIGVFIVTRS